MKRIVVNVLLPILLLVLAGLGARSMMSSAESAQSESPAEVAPLVEVAEAAPYRGRVYIEGNGIVEAEREASLSSEVSGRVVHVSDAFAEGSRVEQGHELLRIDRSRYRLALRQQRAQLRQAELEVEVERNAGEAARREWSVAGREPPADARRIALRVPQLELAESNVDVARAAVEAAKLDLERTVVRAPFNATIASKSVEHGDYVSPGLTVARLVGTDRFLARVSVPVEDVQLLARARAQGPLPVSLTQRLDEHTRIERSGTVLHISSELDRESRTAQVLIGIEHPLDPPEGQEPLLVGSFVTARIEGPELSKAVVVPRRALVQGNHVWVADGDDRLRKRKLEIAFGDVDEVIATGGIEPGERIVLTTLVQPLEAMRVRIDPEERA